MIGRSHATRGVLTLDCGDVTSTRSLAASMPLLRSPALMDGIDWLKPLKTELDILRDVSERLAFSGFAFMLTGSVAMNYYAQPRMTRDIDVVIALEESDTGKLMDLFKQDYYVDRESVARAIAQRSIFNLIHQDSVIKVDCIVRKDDPYRQEEFARRRPITIGDFQTWIVSLEDLILSKLHWARDSRSELQLGDVRNLLGLDFDLEYARSRARTLGVEQLLDEHLPEA